LGKAPENEVKIPGKNFPKTLVYHAKLSSFMEDCYGKCCSIHQWKFPEIQTPHSLFMVLPIYKFYSFIKFLNSNVVISHSAFEGRI